MYKIIALFLLFTIIGACGQKKEINKSQQDEIATTESTMNTKPKEVQHFSIKISDNLQDKFRNNRSVLNKKHTFKILSVLDEITPITKKMIHATDNDLESLLKQTNQIVQRNGFKDLDDYGKELFTVTWAAGTFLKLQEIEKLKDVNSNAKSVQFLTENLDRRLKKQPISLKDIKLIRKNWEKINSALNKMSELAEEKMNS